MSGAHPLNDGIHTYVRLDDLGIDRKYKVSDFGTFKGVVKNIYRECPTVKLGECYLILDERYQRIVDALKLRGTENLYVAYCGPGKRGRPDFHFYDDEWGLIV